MAATSYSGLQSLPYSSLGSQGDLYHSANYGTYDSGVGLLTSHPYQYQTTNYGNDYLTNPQDSSYPKDYLQSNYSTQQPTYGQDSSSNNYSLSHLVRQNERPAEQNHLNDNYPTPTTNTIQSQRKPNVDNHQVGSNSQQQQPYGNTTQHHPPAPTNNQRQQPPVTTQHQQPPVTTQHQQPPITTQHQQPQATTQHHPPAPTNNQRQQQQQQVPSPPKQQPQRQQPQFNTDHSNNKSNNPTPKQRSQSNDRHGPSSETPPKTFNPPRETKPTKSSQMRAAAIKQKEENREQKRKQGNFPSLNKKPITTKTQQPLTDDEQTDTEKIRHTKNGSHSVPKQHKSRRDKNQTEDNNSSADDDRHEEERQRNRTKKRREPSDSQREKYPPMLPPVRPGRGPPYYDPAYDYPPPFAYPPYRERYPPMYEDYGFYRPYQHPYDPRYRRMYEDGNEAPPYIGSYNDPYDGFFDYEKRKSKSKTKHRKEKKEGTSDYDDRGGVTGNETEYDDEAKSQYSKKSKNPKHKVKDDENIKDNHHRRQYNEHPPFYDGRDMLEAWRQERNDYLKSKFKPSVHDVLYSQQWMKSDSYLENQRRRALRDTQGYYFPYKKYTLKDYKDLQKTEAQHNPYASANEPTLDRKDRARKRHDYGSQVERQGADQSEGQGKTPRDAPVKKHWHISNSDPHDPEKLSKRERALEYAKVQVVKNRSLNNQIKNRSNEVDPTEEYVNNLFPETNNDENEVNGNNQSVYDDDDQ